MRPRTTRTRTPAITLAAVLAAGLAGCVVGPTYRTPPPPGPGAYGPRSAAPVRAAAGPTQRFVEGADVAGRWWTLFGSARLDALVDGALTANPDLYAAQAALRAAREAWRAQRGALLPTADAGYSVIRQQANGTLAPPLANNNDLYTLHTAQLTIAYAPDVFGGVRRGIESARAQAEAQRFQTEAAYLTLTSNLTLAAIQAAALRDQIEATSAIIASAQKVLAIMRRQQALGEIGGADVAAQETLLAQAQAALPPLERQLTQQRDLIADLAGRLPGEAAAAEPLKLADLTLPADLPLSLPSRLVEQRPDIRAAAANLHAASAQVGVAIANRLPSLTLGANGGGAAGDIGSLFAPGNGFWTLSAAAAQPVFDGGNLLHRQRGAQAALDQARAQYRSTVLAAFQNVADTLAALRADGRSLDAAAAAETGARRSLDIARRQLELDQSGAVSVLTAEQAWRGAVIGRLQAQAARYADTVALFQALGGGWWNRAETKDDFR